MKPRDPIRTGEPDVEPSLPSHTAGVHQGNARGNYESMVGHHRDGTSSAARSTGINPQDSEPISDDMPNLSPA
jgi:hypothetical protein